MTTTSPITGARRGNALLLVSGLLVMLTLIAAAYLSRSRTQRITAAAVHETAADSTRASLIAQQLASDVSQHLFLRPIDPNSAGAGIVGGNSAAARKAPSAFDMRYGVEGASTFTGASGRGDMLLDTLDPQNPLRIRSTTSNRGDGWPDGYNFAPFAVIPWTNWPDHLTPVDMDNGGDPGNNRFFPFQPQLDVLTSPAASGSMANNPLGNPGFGDTRWLRSTEPVRMTEWRLLAANNTTPLPTVPDGAFFSHWQHLSFPATANNGWRVVPDISDIEGHATVGGEATRGKYFPGSISPPTGSFVGGALTGDMQSGRDGLGVPYEQWSAYRRPTPIPTTGLTATSNDPALAAVGTWVDSFSLRRNQWFSRTEYLRTMGAGTPSQIGNGSRMLPNLFKLDDPLGIGRAVNPSADPVPASDEYIENSPRNIVSRTFADADGDGWTDSFWFLAPIGQEKNVRTVVGVSIVDNGGMVDLNVATRADRHTTIGFTPADLALVSSEPEGADMGSKERSAMAELGGAPWTDTRVGLLDSPRNFTRGRFSAGDPKLGFNPSGTESSLYDLTGFEQAFDHYRWAGRPSPQIPGTLQGGVSRPTLTEGEPTLLSALGLWFDAGDSTRPDLNFWNGYVHSEPRSASRNPLSFNPPEVDLAWATVREQLIEGPWRASAPPGTPSRWSQSEPLFATVLNGQDPTQQGSWRWESWVDASFVGLNSAPNPSGRYVGSPFMRPEERARWFRHALTGELRAYGPFQFGQELVDATELLVPNAAVPREFLGESIRTRPFDATDEIELRAFGGLNNPGNMSRLERALNGEDLNRSGSRINDTLLRSTVLRGESGIAGAQLSNAQWVKDLRRKMTVISGQRNELMPPHLWVGRPYLAESRNAGLRNSYEYLQNAALWLDLHPDVPGPRDEDGDGVISATELAWGAGDLMRVSTSADPYPDGVGIQTSPPVLSPADWQRGVSLFEQLNQKFDLRRPLVIQRRLEQWDLELLPTAGNAKPFINERGLVDETGRPRMAFAYSAQEQRRAMIDFALEARQRLRPALRSVSPSRQRTSTSSPFDAMLFELGPRQAVTRVDGTVNVAYAGYTDRFLDQLRLTLSAKVAGAVANDRRDRSLRTDHWSLLANVADPNGATLSELAWRSAWSSEALTASLAANLATWRSRPDLIRENAPFPFVWPPKLGWGVGDLAQRFGTEVPLRPVSQPILPWFESGAYQQKPDGNPYFSNSGAVDPNGLPVNFATLNQRPDYGDSPVRNDLTRKMRDWSVVQAIRAVDPSKPSTKLPNAGVPSQPAQGPDENTADLVFPGNEKHPFLTECFFSWVYPATTFDDPNTSKVAMPTEGRGWGSYRRFPNDLPLPSPDQYDVSSDPDLFAVERTALTTAKYVAVVNGQVGAPRLVPDLTDPRNNELDASSDPLRRNLIPTAMAMDWSRGLWRPGAGSTPGQPSREGAAWLMEGTGDFDARRDELNEIRTPVLVVQVANPWNEPLRLGDFRLNIFGNLYDFPDYEIDANGQPVLDSLGVPVPLMLPPATEMQPATATVYLIADVVGNDGNDLLGLAQRIDVERVEESDLADVAMYDPLFRRRWLDYLDLYEYSDGAALRDVNGNPLSRAVTSVVRPPLDRSTSPRTSCLFAGPTQFGDSLDSLPRSKLLNAMDRSDDAISGTLTKRRITDLWKFKNSLTPDAMRQGVVLERILRDPSGRNGSVAGAGNWQNRTEVVTNDYTNRFSRTGLAPAESTIDRYRLRFWPMSGSTNVFPRDSRAPESIFPPRNSTTGASVQRSSVPAPNLLPTVEPTTLAVDRFDGDDDFNHWTTVANARMGFESARTPEPSVTDIARDVLKGTPVTAFSFTGTPLQRPEDQQSRFFENPFLNQDRNLVTGGRFWTACAQITLPPTRMRWPDGRDRRMIPNPAGWIAPSAGSANVGSDIFWHDWSKLPSAPVLLGSTMIVSDTPSPVMMQHFLSRLEARRDLTGTLSYRLGIAAGSIGSIAAGQGEWFPETTIFDPANPSAGFDRNAPRGVLDAQELASICTAFPHLDRDRNQVPDEVQKVFIGFDEPEGSIYSFPPATAASLNRNVTFYQFNPVPADMDIAGEVKPYYPPVRGWPYQGTEEVFQANPPDGRDRTPGYRGLLAPGINLRTATESRDYFLTWTRVSRTWSRLFEAKLATLQQPVLPLPASSSGFDSWNSLQLPGSLLGRQANITGTGGITSRQATYQGSTGGATGSVQGTEVANRPMWEWTRQIVNSSSNGSDPSGIAFNQVAAGVDEGVTPYQGGGGAPTDSDGNIRARLGTAASSWLDGNVNLTAWFGAFAPDRVAPRFVFASRTEPDRCDRPVDMRQTQGVLSPALLRRGDSRPIRQELLGYQSGRYPAAFIGRPGYKAERGSPLVEPNVISRMGLPIFRAPLSDVFVRSPAPGGLGSALRESYQWIVANDGELLSALGDTFAMEPPRDPGDPSDANRKPRDPDGWTPDPLNPGTTVATATEAENDLRWMDAVRSFNWLTRPVIAPLPDLQGLGWSAGGVGGIARMATTPNAEDALPNAAFPELIMRKPTGFNCQTVVDDRLSRDMAQLPYEGASEDFSRGAPIPAYRRFLYAKYANFVPAGGFEQKDGVTRFVYPPWARQAARAGQPTASSGSSFALRFDPAQGDTDGDGQFDDAVPYGMDLYPEQSSGRLSIYRVYMGDKGGRLIDHNGRALVLDRVTFRPALHDGDVLQGARLGNGNTDDTDASRFPIAALQKRLGLGFWRMQGVWNTLDRLPHGESLQMLHKDDDFEQLGELADVFLWGPAYRLYQNPQTSATAGVAEWSPYGTDGTPRGSARGGWLRPTDLQTTVDYNATSVATGVTGTAGSDQLVPPRLVSQCRATFAEIMTGRVPGFPVGEGPMVNRLQTDPPNVAFNQPAAGDPSAENWGEPRQYGGTSALSTPYAPNVPWGMRVFDAFTLDGPGGALRYDWSDQFAGRSVELATASGALSLTTGTSATNVFPFEDAGGNPGNPNFNPSAQDGAPSPGTNFGTFRMVAARPAGALIPLDVYRDSVNRSTGTYQAFASPVVTRASMAQWEHDRSPGLSGGFRGLSVPGLLNVNTASVEALRSLPHMNQMVYDDSGRYRISGSPQFSLHTTASETPFVTGLAGALPASSGLSPLNTDGQFVNISTAAGDRAQNPTTKLPESMIIYRDGLNPNLSLAGSSTTASDWFIRDSLNPMEASRGGSVLGPTGGNLTLAPSFPIYPSYVDRGDGAGADAVIGTGLNATGAQRNPFFYVHYNRGMRASPGLATIGEVLGLGRSTRSKINGDGSPSVLPAAPGFTQFPDWQYDQSWSVRLAGLDPFRKKRFDLTSGQGWQSYISDPDGQLTPDPLDARLSTDRQGVRTFEFSIADRYNNTTGAIGPDGFRDLTVNDAFRVEPDSVAGDSEERNMLFKGISNMVSTRSDVFTAYFRVKTVKQGADGRWNAMDPESILSEGRYVMCIDRSKVNRPTDKPRIVYFTKVND